MVNELKTLWDLDGILHDEKSCRELLEQQRWNGVPVCPHCGLKSEKHYKLKRNGEFNGLYKCPSCRKRFTVTVGTIYHGHNLPLGKWFRAIIELLAKKGLSSLQLVEKIHVSKPTAWKMLRALRSHFNDPLITKFEGIVQMDETYIGGKNKRRFNNNRGRSNKYKTPVVGVLTKDKVRVIVVEDTKKKTLHTIAYGLIEPGSILVTDEWGGYNGLSGEFIHETVEHGIKKYVNERGFHTNGIEGFWSHLKRGLKGTYHWVSRKYLQLYCDEFAYKYCTRSMTSLERFMLFISTPGRKRNDDYFRYEMS